LPRARARHGRTDSKASRSRSAGATSSRALLQLLRITHTRDEFVLDFINLVRRGIVTGRVVTSPGSHEARARRRRHQHRRYEET